MPDLRAQIEAYFAEAGRVAGADPIFADALVLAPDFFERFTTTRSTCCGRTASLCRRDTVHLDGDLTGMGEHTDFGIVTVLWPNLKRPRGGASGPI